MKTPVLIVMHGVNRDADRYHFNLSGPETNIAGGFGVFGAAAETRRTVVWR